MYDGRVGRWMTTDPYSQFHSPYLAMGNSSINQIDPDGGLSGDEDNDDIDLLDPQYNSLSDGNYRYSVPTVTPSGNNYTQTVLNLVGGKTKDAPFNTNAKLGGLTPFTEDVINISVTTMNYSLLAVGGGSSYAKNLTYARRMAGMVSKVDDGARIFSYIDEGIETLDDFARMGSQQPPPVTFNLAKNYMQISQMSKYIKEIEVGFKYAGKKLPADYILSTNQLNALKGNLKLVITKSIPKAKTLKSVQNMLNRPRWRFIDQIPGGRAALNKAIKDLNVTFGY